MARQSRPPLILLTRPFDQSRRLAGDLARAYPGAPVLISPVTEIILQPPDRIAAGFRGLILTSENGARAAALMRDRLRATGHALPGTAYCVGPQTAAAARRIGLAAVEIGGDARSLVEALLALRPQGPLLHLHGRETQGNIAEALTSAGLQTHAIVAYGQLPLALSAAALSALNGAEPVLLPLYSRQSLARLAAQGPFAAPLLVVALSAAIGDAALCLAPLRLKLAQKPDGTAMIRAMGEFLAKPNLAGRADSA